MRLPKAPACPHTELEPPDQQRNRRSPEPSCALYPGSRFASDKEICPGGTLSRPNALQARLLVTSRDLRRGPG
ncbi:hypothetical protein GCM10027269_47200 [Kribbella endophytica]